jgi:hypothetical protein
MIDFETNECDLAQLWPKSTEICKKLYQFLRTPKDEKILGDEQKMKTKRNELRKC